VSTVIVPPCAATSAAAMDSPSPPPPLARLRAWSGPVEPVENPDGLFGGHPGPGVGDRELALTGRGGHGHGDRCARRDPRPA
jgi:hypothetical protein